MMKYDEYEKVMRSADSKEISALIRFAMKNPSLHEEYMKRYNGEKVNRSIGKHLKVMEIAKND